MSWRTALVSVSGRPTPIDSLALESGAETAVDVEKILVIHNNEPRSQQALGQILVPAGYDVVGVAYPPVTVMEAFLKTKPALVVLDIGLSGKPVEDLCRKLRGESREVTIFVLGSSNEVEDKVSLLNLGADDYMTKPIDGAEFLARVTTRTNWLTRRRR
jgi:two-component system, OmpR family, KDP operon response regulator KdpE